MDVARREKFSVSCDDPAPLPNSSTSGSGGCVRSCRKWWRFTAFWLGRRSIFYIRQALRQCLAMATSHVYRKQKLNRLLRLEQPENYSGWALIEYNQTEEVLKESIVESSHRRVLHRPSAPTELIRHVESPPIDDYELNYHKYLYKEDFGRSVLPDLALRGVTSSAQSGHRTTEVRTQTKDSWRYCSLKSNVEG